MSAEKTCEASTTESLSLPWAGLGTDTAMGEPDLAYLLTAQRLVRRDRASAMFRLGIRVDLVELLEQLSPQQLARIAASQFPCDVAAGRPDDPGTRGGLVGRHGRDQARTESKI